MRELFCSERHGRFPATRLHLPNEDIRKLGFPILALPQKGVISTVLGSADPAVSSKMQPFLEFIGIQRYPSLDTIIQRASSEDPEIQQPALQYLLSNLDTLYDAYKPDDFADRSFIPTKSGSRARLNEVMQRVASDTWNS